MKRKFVLKSAITIGAILFISSALLAQITGNSNVVTEKRDVNNFTGVKVKSGIDVIIQQGNSASLEIKADENLQEYIISEVKDRVLHVYIKENTNILKRKAMDALVTVKTIEKLNVSGGGDVHSESVINAKDLAISVSGGGDLDMGLNSEGTNISMSGGGDVELSGTMADLKTSVSGGGDLELHLDVEAEMEKLALSMSGGGDSEISGGHVPTAALSISGGGDLEMEMSSEKITVSMTGGGDAEVRAGDGVGDAAFTINGGGNLNLMIWAEKLAVSVGGGGNATLEGSADDLGAEIRSGGDMSANEFIAKDAGLKLTGGSDAHIHVTGKLSVNASGGGQVWVTGDPQIESRLTGGSKVHKK